METGGEVDGGDCEGLLWVEGGGGGLKPARLVRREGEGGLAGGEEEARARDVHVVEVAPASRDELLVLS